MHRVAVTGLGAISAIGLSSADMFNAAVNGRSGVRLAPELAVGSAIPLVASADFDPTGVVPKKRSAPMDRATAMALAVAQQAASDAGATESLRSSRTGIFWGTGMGGARTLEDGYRSVFQANNWRLRPTSVVTAMTNAPTAVISMEFGVTGPTLTYSVACASSAAAIGEGMRAIRHGFVDCAIVGGSEALLTQGILSAWTALRTLAVCDLDDASRSCKPFAANRSGFVLGEGAAALVLANEEWADKHCERIYCELAGYGLTSDATHISDPSVTGQSQAMTLAMLDAKVTPSEVGYVNAHGTATVVGDRVEAESIAQAFGLAASGAAVSSTKALHGHVMGATGALEFIIAILALQSGTVPPTANLAMPDPALDLDFVPNVGRFGQDLRAVASNSFAFGGTNAVLVAKRW